MERARGVKREYGENPIKIIRWETGELQCFRGTEKEAWEYAGRKEKETGVKCAAVI